ncbi:MAG: hypothetical protein ACFFAL_06440 [Promethearchaeota archaeon]
MVKNIGGGYIITSWRQHWDDPRTPKMGKYYVWVAVVIQVALSGFMISLGMFTVIFNFMNLALGIIPLVPPLDLRFWYYWVSPFFMVIHGIIGFVFAKAWHNLASYIPDNALHLVALAFFSLVIGFMLPMFWLSQLIFVNLMETWLNAFILNTLYWIVFMLSFFPGLLVIVAGGGVQLYKILRKEPIDSSIPALRGVRTSHFMVARVLHREQDRFREKDT